MPAAPEFKTYDMRKTSNEVDVVVHNLINHANDDSDQVKMTISRSLAEIAQHEPELVVSGIAAYVSKRNDKIDSSHRIQLLQILIRVLEDVRDKLSIAVGTDIVTFCCQELTLSAEVKSDWQGPASQALVLLSGPFPDCVLENLLSVFKPGVEPHYYVIKTLADVANANSVSMVLQLREVLSRVMPVLGLIRKPAMKWAFTTALGRFAEAILFFEDNATVEQKIMVSAIDFEGDMSSAWDVIFSKWLGDNEPKVKFAVVESLGYISAVLGDRDFDIRIQKLVPTFLQMYKKEARADHLSITQGMCAVLGKAVKCQFIYDTPLFLTQLMTGLHEIVSLPPQDPNSNPNALRNTNEVLRCWEVLGRALPDQTLSFLISRFQLKVTPVRIGSLVILRHFVNSIDSILKDRKPIIMSAVTTLINENDPSLRLTILQLIASMGNQDYLVLDGGESLLKFTALQAASKLPDKAKEPAIFSTISTIKKSAEHMLGVFALRVQSAIDVMWPYVLELLNESALTNANSILYRVIYDICRVKKDNDDPTYIINFRKHVNLPAATTLITKIFILLSQPHKQLNLGTHVANACVYLGESLHPALGTYWIDTMPALIEYLSEQPTDDTFPLAKWQDTILKVFKETLSVVEEESWLSELAQEFGRCLNQYKDPETIRLIYRFLGATLSRVQNRSVVHNLLDNMIASVTHTNEAEQRGLAQGLGMAGNPHLDIVLPKITDLLTTTPEHRKSSGFFGFGAKKDAGPEDEVKATCILSYGYITASANPELILSRLDVHVLHNLIPLLNIPVEGQKPKDPTPIAPILKVQIAKALDLVGKTVNPLRLPTSQRRFQLKRRDDLVKGLLMMIDERENSPNKEKPTKELRLLVLGSIATLSLLEPTYEKAMLERVFDHIMPLYSLLTTDKPVASADKDKKKEKEKEAPKSPEPAKKNAKPKEVKETEDGELLSNALTSVLQSLVQSCPTVDLVLHIVGKLEKLLGHKSALVRQRAVSSYLVVLKKFVPKISQEGIPQKESCFPELGKHLAHLIPRMCETVDVTRGLAVECVQALLYLDQLLNNPSEPKSKSELKMLTELKNTVSEPAPTTPSGLLVLTTNEVALRRYPSYDDVMGIVTSVSTIGEVVALIRALIGRFTDSDSLGAIGATRCFTKLISVRGPELKGELKETITALLEAMKKITQNEVKIAAANAFRMITKLHFEDSINFVLKGSTTPLPKESIEYFLALADPLEGVLTMSGVMDEDSTGIRIPGLMSNKELSEKTLLHLLTVINDTPLDAKTATPLVQAATCALNVILQVSAKDAITVKKDDSEEDVVDYIYQNSVHQAYFQEFIRTICVTHYSAILATSMMRCGTSFGVEDEGVSSRQAIRCLKCVFRACDQERVLVDIDEKKDNQVMDGKDSIGLMLKKEVENVWKTLQSETFDDSITIITRVVCRWNPESMPTLLEFVTNFYSTQAYKGQRIVATAILAEFVTHSATEGVKKNLQSELIKFLLPRVADKLAKVRKQALRGMGNLVMVWNSDVSQHATAVISSLSGASEDTDAEVATEAVNALTRIVKMVDVVTMGPMLVSICFRMRPAFDRKQKKIRSAAFALFSELCRFGKRIEEDDGATNDNFLEQMHTNLPIYLCHIRDVDAGVREQVLIGIKSISALLNDDLVALCNKHEDIDEDDYDGFVNEYTRLLCLKFGDKLRSYLDGFCGYYGSTWMNIRSAAVYCVAAVLKHSKTSDTTDARKKLNVHALTGGLVKMLEQEDEQVRYKTAKALALLFDI